MADLFADHIPLLRPWLGNDELKAVAEVLESWLISQGPRVAAFEAAVARYVGASQADQRLVMQTLLDAGIATRRGIMCAHREPAYPRDAWSCAARPGTCECPPGHCRRLAQSERAQDRAIILPLFDQLTEAEQDTVVETLDHACAVSQARP